MTPQTIDRYEVKARLGKGGMATVYHAYDPRFKRDVAIKVMPREFLHDETFRARFELEAQTIAALEHWAIVPVYDFGEHEEQPFLVMRYMPGGPLADRIREGPLPLDEMARIIERIGAALDSAHRRNVIHRDVKPANILFDHEGAAYLSDFGIVKVSEATAQLTGSGIIGTPSYMAPEMADRGGVTPLIDIYALGITLYQMVTGHLPFDADTPLGMLMAHASKPVPDARHVRPDLPAGVQAVIERAMAKDPAQRYQSAGRLADDLNAAVADWGEMRLAPVPPDAPTMDMIDHTLSPEWAAGVQHPPAETMPLAEPARVDVSAPSLSQPAQHRGIPAWLWIIGGMVIVCGAVIGIGLLVLGGGDVLRSIASRSTNVPATEAGLPTPTTPAKSVPTDEPTPAPTTAPTSTAFGGGGGLIAFESNRDDNLEIYVSSADGTKQTRLTNSPTEDGWATWSPDGTKIAFVTRRDEPDPDNCLPNCNNEIYVMNADGSGQKRLTDNAAGDSHPSWSPDGMRIVFETVRDGNWEIYVMNADGTDQTRLTSSPEEDREPVWSPDGKRIAFTSARDGNSEIYVMNADGKNQTRLTNNEAWDGGVAWSPEGSKLAFTSDRDGNWEIYVMNTDGTNQTRLTTSWADDGWPTWSPDGTQIAFETERDGNWEIYIMNADGTKQTNLTNHEADDWDAAWQP